MKDKIQFSHVKDSGIRETFAMGSRRDAREGKGRFDLITPIGLKRLAIHYENGAKKYGDRNWEKGQPVSRYLDSAERHINDYKEGKREEDHLAAVAWNALSAIHTIEMVKQGFLPAELDDIQPPGAITLTFVVTGAKWHLAKSKSKKGINHGKDLRVRDGKRR